MTSEVQILELGVHGYKGLERLRVPWAERVVVHGVNGSGKTNLLEALALAFGSRASLWQLAPRVALPFSASIDVLITGTRHELPLPPALVGTSGTEGGAGTPGHPIADARRFWETLGITHGESWESAVAEFPHDDVADLLRRAGERPLVRYHLDSITGIDEAQQCYRGRAMHEEVDDDPDLVEFRRVYSRTLVVPSPPPAWLVELAPRLPEAFAPLRRWLDEPDEDRGACVDLLALPPRDWAPVQVVWLASERTANEAYYDLWDAYTRAAPAAVALGRALDRLLLRDSNQVDANSEADHRDARFWLMYRAASAADALLELIAPDVEVTPDGEYPNYLHLGARGGLAGRRPTAYLSDAHFFSTLSSGQRSWVDVGLAQGAAALEDLHIDAEWIARGLNTLDDAGVLDAALELEGLLSTEVTSEGYWPADDIDRALSYVRRLLGDAVNALAGPEVLKAIDRDLVIELWGGVTPTWRTALQPMARIHLYDEPERHLHPAAQRRVIEYLDAPLDAAVAIATHSHLFLGLSGWRHVHISPTPEGTVVTSFDPTELNPSHAVTRQLGLDRGELLALVRYVLFVEGPVDEIMLNAFYGELLAEAGVCIVPIHGIDEVASLAQLELLARVLDVNMGVLADHVRTDRLARKTPATKEERALIDVEKRMRKRGRQLDLFGLRGEDILVYVHDEAARSAAPNFTSWTDLRARRRKGQSLKDVFEEVTGGHAGVRFAASAVAAMRESGQTPGGDMPDIVASIVEAASS